MNQLYEVVLSIKVRVQADNPGDAATKIERRLRSSLATSTSPLLQGAPVAVSAYPVFKAVG